MFTCTRKQAVTTRYSIQNSTVGCTQKFLLLQFRSKSEHKYCMCDFGNRFSLERRSKLLFREEIFVFFSCILIQKGLYIYIYIKHRYKKVSSTSCVWQHLLRREVPLIPRYKDQAHFCCESKYQKWWELHILCWPFFWKDHTLFPSLLPRNHHETASAQMVNQLLIHDSCWQFRETPVGLRNTERV